MCTAVNKVSLLDTKSAHVGPFFWREFDTKVWRHFASPRHVQHTECDASHSPEEQTHRQTKMSSHIQD